MGSTFTMTKIQIVKNSKRFKLLKSIFKSSDVKRSSRPLDSIKDVHRKDEKQFVLDFKDEKKNKAITYEWETKDECSQILAKFEYLFKNNRPAQE